MQRNTQKKFRSSDDFSFFYALVLSPCNHVMLCGNFTLDVHQHH